ncbi:MAG: hypothetical protein HYY17_09730 [Planctomycetes bacterium]|nr:hypothetical protein [Planctomycetota bacterium]
MLKRIARLAVMAGLTFCLGSSLIPVGSAAPESAPKAGWCTSTCPEKISRYEKCGAQCRYKEGHGGSHTCLRWHSF